MKTKTIARIEELRFMKLGILNLIEIYVGRLGEGLEDSLLEELSIHLQSYKQIDMEIKELESKS